MNESCHTKKRFHQANTLSHATPTHAQSDVHWGHASGHWWTGHQHSHIWMSHVAHKNESIRLKLSPALAHSNTHRFSPSETPSAIPEYGYTNYDYNMTIQLTFRQFLPQILRVLYDSRPEHGYTNYDYNVTIQLTFRQLVPQVLQILYDSWPPRGEDS